MYKYKKTGSSPISVLMMGMTWIRLDMDDMATMRGGDYTLNKKKTHKRKRFNFCTGGLIYRLMAVGV